MSKHSRVSKHIASILIVCEGETEVQYFTALRNKLKIGTMHINLQTSNQKTEPEQVVNKAKEFICTYREIYCVFDKDMHATFDDAEKEVERIKKDKKIDIKAIVSVPCFEYWILLHYQYTNQNFYSNQTPCKNAEKLLKKDIPNYSKPYKNFKSVVDKFEIAIKHAEQSKKAKGDNDEYSYTDVVEVVKRMRDIAISQGTWQPCIESKIG